MMKDNIMFEPIIDFSLWGHIKEKDNTLVHGGNAEIELHIIASYYSCIFKYDLKPIYWMPFNAYYDLCNWWVKWENVRI